MLGLLDHLGRDDPRHGLAVDFAGQRPTRAVALGVRARATTAGFPAPAIALDERAWPQIADLSELGLESGTALLEILHGLAVARRHGPS
jgi:hypothetical protein